MKKFKAFPSPFVFLMALDLSCISSARYCRSQNVIVCRVTILSWGECHKCV